MNEVQRIMLQNVVQRSVNEGGCVSPFQVVWYHLSWLNIQSLHDAVLAMRTLCCEVALNRPNHDAAEHRLGGGRDLGQLKRRIFSWCMRVATLVNSSFVTIELIEVRNSVCPLFRQGSSSSCIPSLCWASRRHTFGISVESRSHKKCNHVFAHMLVRYSVESQMHNLHTVKQICKYYPKINLAISCVQLTSRPIPQTRKENHEWARSSIYTRVLHAPMPTLQYPLSLLVLVPLHVTAFRVNHSNFSNSFTWVLAFIIPCFNSHTRL